MFSTIPNAFTWPEHPSDDHLLNLTIHAKADYLVTWETRILGLHVQETQFAKAFRGLAPNLKIVNPKQFAEKLHSLGASE